MLRPKGVVGQALKVLMIMSGDFGSRFSQGTEKSLRAGAGESELRKISRLRVYACVTIARQCVKSTRERQRLFSFH